MRELQASFRGETNTITTRKLPQISCINIIFSQNVPLRGFDLPSIYFRWYKVSSKFGHKGLWWHCSLTRGVLGKFEEGFGFYPHVSNSLVQFRWYKVCSKFGHQGLGVGLQSNHRDSRVNFKGGCFLHHVYNMYSLEDIKLVPTLAARALGVIIGGF